MVSIIGHFSKKLDLKKFNSSLQLRKNVLSCGMHHDQLKAYVAPENLEADLELEIQRKINQGQRLKIEHQLGQVFIVSGPELQPIFSHSTWKDPSQHNYKSISDAVKILRAHGALWAIHSENLHRRSLLIQEQLPKVKKVIQDFNKPLPERNLGGWLLVDENQLWISPQTTSPFSKGMIQWNETKAAPSRAYLKLWEFFAKENIYPKPGEKCIDLGSSPGGWTWVLDQLNCEIFSVDKAPLVDTLKAKPNITSIKKDAFTLKPNDIGKIDWLFSDIICYPNKLLELVHLWLDSNLVRNFVCTIKFQGETDFETMDQFLKIPGSKIQHLSVNKHEVTWSLIR